MAEAQKPRRHHTVQIEERGMLKATGVSHELITARTDLSLLHIKGEGLHIESLDADSGDLLARGKVTALSYTEGGQALSFFGRLFK